MSPKDKFCGWLKMRLKNPPKSGAEYVLIRVSTNGAAYILERDGADPPEHVAPPNAWGLIKEAALVWNDLQVDGSSGQHRTIPTQV